MRTSNMHFNHKHQMQTSTKCCFKECLQKMHASWNHQITQMVKRIVSNYRLANCNYKSIWRKQLIQLIQALNEDDPSAKYKNCTSKILITILCKWHIWNKTNQEKYLLLRVFPTVQDIVNALPQQCCKLLDCTLHKKRSALPTSNLPDDCAGYRTCRYPAA